MHCLAGTTPKRTRQPIVRCAMRERGALDNQCKIAERWPRGALHFVLGHQKLLYLSEGHFGLGYGLRGGRNKIKVIFSFFGLTAQRKRSNTCLFHVKTHPHDKRGRDHCVAHHLKKSKRCIDVRGLEIAACARRRGKGERASDDGRHNHQGVEDADHETGFCQLPLLRSPSGKRLCAKRRLPRVGLKPERECEGSGEEGPFGRFACLSFPCLDQTNELQDLFGHAYTQVRQRLGKRSVRVGELDGEKLWGKKSVANDWVSDKCNVF